MWQWTARRLRANWKLHQEFHKAALDVTTTHSLFLLWLHCAGPVRDVASRQPEIRLLRRTTRESQQSHEVQCHPSHGGCSEPDSVLWWEFEERKLQHCRRLVPDGRILQRRRPWLRRQSNLVWSSRLDSVPFRQRYCQLERKPEHLH